MKIKTVEVYEVESGEVFNDLRQAKAFEKILKFNKWYENNKLYGNFDGCRIEAEDFIIWLRDNKQEVTKLLKVL